MVYAGRAAAHISKALKIITKMQRAEGQGSRHACRIWEVVRSRKELTGSPKSPFTLLQPSHRHRITMKAPVD
eukprot:653609-Pelagomonas_calceolata.AAC.2